MENLKNITSEQLIEVTTQLHQLIQLKDHISKGNLKVDTKQMVKNFHKSKPKKFMEYAKRLIETHGYDAKKIDIKQIKNNAVQQKKLIREQFKIFCICNRNDIDFQKIITTENKNVLFQVRDYIWNCERNNELRDLKWEVSKYNNQKLKFPACVKRVIKNRIEIINHQITRHEMYSNLETIKPMVFGSKGSQNFKIVYDTKNQDFLKSNLLQYA